MALGAGSGEKAAPAPGSALPSTHTDTPGGGADSCLVGHPTPTPSLQPEAGCRPAGSGVAPGLGHRFQEDHPQLLQLPRAEPQVLECLLLLSDLYPQGSWGLEDHLGQLSWPLPQQKKQLCATVAFEGTGL